MGSGGREQRVVELAALLPREVEHVFVAFDGDTAILARMPADVKFTIEPPPVAQGLLGRLRAIRAVIRRLHADLVLTYNWGAIEWAMAARFRKLCPVVHHEDGFGKEEAQRQLRRRVLARRLVLSRAGGVIVPSRHLHAIASREWRLREPPLVYLPNGVDCVRYAPRTGTRPAGPVVFVAVGYLRKEKNQALAIEAFARARCNSAARLRVVGDGPELGAIKALARARGVSDRVDFAGMVTDTSPEYRGCDVFLNSSSTEQMPLSLLEAMATGLPVVATDVGDVRAMVDPCNADWIVPPDDPDALGRAMDAAFDDPRARVERGAANRVRAQREYDRERCYRRYCDLYLATARGTPR
ncbi:MAG: glycosyltransferase family 4 protein [Planctomycetes bacterium]|nr:glycosyltransferase family 4 protein [Planctomycetota bacterium]